MITGGWEMAMSLAWDGLSLADEILSAPNRDENLAILKMSHELLVQLVMDSQAQYKYPPLDLISDLLELLRGRHSGADGANQQ